MAYTDNNPKWEKLARYLAEKEGVSIEELEAQMTEADKPQLLPISNLDPLRKILKEYIDFQCSVNYHEDNDYKHFVFECALKTFYGADVFQKLEKINK